MLVNSYYNLPKIETVSSAYIPEKNKLYAITNDLKEEADSSEAQKVTTLFNAIEKNDISLTRKAINSLINIDSITSKPETALIKAVKQRYLCATEKEKETNYEIIHLLLLAKANPNLAFKVNTRTDGFDSSSLNCALANSDVKLAMLLLDYGAQLQYAFDPKKNNLKKQDLSIKEKDTYKLAKNDVKAKHIFFQKLCNNENLPQDTSEFIVNIIPKVENAYQKKIEEAKQKSLSKPVENRPTIKLVENQCSIGYVGMY